LGIAIGYLFYAYPDVGKAEDIQIKIAPERVARGEYLANHVNLCMDCHSVRQWDKFGTPSLAGTEGAGGEHFNQELGFPGDIVSRNITPFALKDWTDGEIYRAITTGVSKDGSALFPVMPYTYYGKMDKEDVYSVIAYIRTLKPIEKENTPTKLDFPLNLLVRTMPQKANPTPMPDKNDILAYGAYMTNAAGCYDCHTNQVEGQFIGEDFAGGFEFNLGNGRIVRSANLTPDKETGIGRISEEAFVGLFKNYREGFTPGKVGPTDFQTPMPWLYYSGMTDDDLKAIYTYLKSIPAKSNKVKKFEIKTAVASEK
jgi:hypothetical protein